ncbi:MAG: acyltransferase [Candidatus Contendobacter sp.]|nr:acyltransferase [Candidatus Contendobacter sp.]
MRQITARQITLFFTLLAVIVLLSVATLRATLWHAPLGDFRGVTLVLAWIILFYLYAFVIYRLFLRVMPLEEGELAEGSRAEFAAQVNILFYLLLFNSLIRTHFLPVPLLRLIYQALGTRMGANTYSAGVILDPPLTELGANCIIGHEGRHFALARIRAGDNVTIGATAVIMSGVSIGDGAIVSAGSVVLKDTRIGPGEIWGGVPAKRLK